MARRQLDDELRALVMDEQHAAAMRPVEEQLRADNDNTDFKQAMSDLFDRHAAEEKRFRALQERVKALQAD